MSAAKGFLPPHPTHTINKRNKGGAKSMRTWKKFGEDHRPEESQDSHSHAADLGQAHHPKFP